MPDVLMSSKADMVIMDYEFVSSGVKKEILGYEEFVVIESRKHSTKEEVYLDHGPHDNATEAFFASQKNAPRFYRRSFMGDVYGIIDGVKAGLGKAVMSRHLVQAERDIKIVTGYSKYQRPITLHYFERPYYPKLFNMVLAELSKKKMGTSV